MWTGLGLSLCVMFFVYVCVCVCVFFAFSEGVNPFVGWWFGLGISGDNLKILVLGMVESTMFTETSCSRTASLHEISAGQEHQIDRTEVIQA